MKGALEAEVSEEDFDKHVPHDNSIAKVTERRNEVIEEFKV